MMQSISLSLSDLCGEDYIRHVCQASAILGLGELDALLHLAHEPVDFFPEAFQKKADAAIEWIGRQVQEPWDGSARGAGTAAFDHALKRGMAPLSGLGIVRIGENGKGILVGKSEHYQASLGHNFPAYRLLDIARAIGVTNITHNNTRGHITRLCEQELVRVANGIAEGDAEGLKAVLDSTAPHVLNRVINLETGSLACEAAFKMMLARFYRLQPQFPAPKYAGKMPVFVVMADRNGGKEANYHGTCISAQLLRGMWSELYEGMEKAGLLKVVPCPINDLDAFTAIVDRYDNGATKIAGFTHELVLMNYGGIRLDNVFVSGAHALCDARDIPVFVDEIQSCMWSPNLFLFRDYGCHPDFVSVGKGFPGGQYPASKMLTTAVMDNLNQFGALVTNGQEELASLSYLITMKFSQAISDHTAARQNQWCRGLQALQKEFPHLLETVEGDGLLSALCFKEPEKAIAFTAMLGERHGIEASVQTYKASCPPAALMKPPLITSEEAMDTILNRIKLVLKEL